MKDSFSHRAKGTDKGKWMQDRYLFKARNACNHTWHVGMLSVEGSVYYMSNLSEEGSWEHMINPCTICQCTGLKDGNGKLIWENDIVTLPDEADALFTVCWDEDTARFCMEGETLTCDFDNYWGNQIEVIGNIFDNPELLAGETEE